MKDTQIWEMVAFLWPVKKIPRSIQIQGRKRSHRAQIQPFLLSKLAITKKKQKLMRLEVQKLKILSSKLIAGLAFIAKMTLFWSRITKNWIQVWVEITITQMCHQKKLKMVEIIWEQMTSTWSILAGGNLLANKNLWRTLCSDEWLRSQICWQLPMKRSLRIGQKRKLVLSLRQTKMNSSQKRLVQPLLLKNPIKKLPIARYSKRFLIWIRLTKIRDRKTWFKRLTARLVSSFLMIKNWQIRCSNKRVNKIGCSNLIKPIKIKIQAKTILNLLMIILFYLHNKLVNSLELCRLRANLMKKEPPSFNFMCAVCIIKLKSIYKLWENRTKSVKKQVWFNFRWRLPMRKQFAEPNKNSSIC